MHNRWKYMFSYWDSFENPDRKENILLIEIVVIVSTILGGGGNATDILTKLKFHLHSFSFSLYVIKKIIYWYKVNIEYCVLELSEQSLQKPPPIF